MKELREEQAVVTDQIAKGSAGLLLSARGWRQHGINHLSVLEDSFQVVQSLLTHTSRRGGTVSHRVRKKRW